MFIFFYVLEKVQNYTHAVHGITQTNFGRMGISNCSRHGTTFCGDSFNSLNEELLMIEDDSAAIK
jgi:hypothetical protein